MPENQSEQYLIKKAQEGDEKSFEALISGCHKKAYNIAFRYLRNEQDALDAIQESYIKIFRSLINFKGESKFDTWVYRIVVNTCNDILRKNSKLKNTDSIYQTKDEKETVLEIPDLTQAPENIVDRQEEANILLECLKKLNQNQKEIIILRDIQGFTYEEISDILQCTTGTVKSRLSRSRLKLREIYLEQK